MYLKISCFCLFLCPIVVHYSPRLLRFFVVFFHLSVLKFYMFCLSHIIYKTQDKKASSFVCLELGSFCFSFLHDILKFSPLSFPSCLAPSLVLYTRLTMNSCRYPSFVNSLIYPCQKDIFAEYPNLDKQFIPFST